MWVAIAGASVITAGPWLIGQSRSSRAALSWFIAAIAVGLAALVVTGLGAALLQRGVEPRPRSAGVSPCGAPLLETVDRHNRSRAAGRVRSHGCSQLNQLLRHEQPGAPRHPDSADLPGASPEAGLLGLGSSRSLIVVVVGSGGHGAAVQPVVGRSSPSSSPALVASPTDFAFLVVLAIGWAAYVSPREAGVPEPIRQGNRPVRLGSMVALAIVAVAYALDVRRLVRVRPSSRGSRVRRSDGGGLGSRVGVRARSGACALSPRSAGSRCT